MTEEIDAEHLTTLSEALPISEQNNVISKDEKAA